MFQPISSVNFQKMSSSFQCRSEIYVIYAFKNISYRSDIESEKWEKNQNEEKKFRTL